MRVKLVGSAKDTLVFSFVHFQVSSQYDTVSGDEPISVTCISLYFGTDPTIKKYTYVYSCILTYISIYKHMILRIELFLAPRKNVASRVIYLSIIRHNSTEILVAHTKRQKKHSIRVERMRRTTVHRKIAKTTHFKSFIASKSFPTVLVMRCTKFFFWFSRIEIFPLESIILFLLLTSRFTEGSSSCDAHTRESSSLGTVRPNMKHIWNSDVVNATRKSCSPWESWW